MSDCFANPEPRDHYVPTISQVPLIKLTVFSPFKNDVWAECYRPITRWEVRKAIRAKWTISPEIKGIYGTRVDHIRRVAWFAYYGWKDPIDLDVGIPSLDYYNGWFVIDGNHRHAAAIFRGDEYIRATISGSLDYAEELFGIKIVSSSEHQ